jgi:hypothetical protein
MALYATALYETALYESAENNNLHDVDHEIVTFGTLHVKFLKMTCKSIAFRNVAWKHRLG